MALSRRFVRRTAGLLHARMPELALHTVPEVRHRQGRKRWRLSTILRAVVVGLVAGCKGLGELEELTRLLARPVRRLLGLPRRLPASDLRFCIHARVRAARRRKALEPEGLPFGVLAIDGKATAIAARDDRYSQKQPYSEGDGIQGLVRTLSCTLVSSRAKVYLDAVPVPPATNETGAFPSALCGLREAYGPRPPFALIAANAAQCVRAHDPLICDEHGLHQGRGERGPPHPGRGPVRGRPPLGDPAGGTGWPVGGRRRLRRLRRRAPRRTPIRSGPCPLLLAAQMGHNAGSWRRSGDQIAPSTELWGDQKRRRNRDHPSGEQRHRAIPGHARSGDAPRRTRLDG